jgi:hypothetical protein
VLPATGSGDFPCAIALIGKVKALLTALGRAAAFSPFAAELRVWHKHNFIVLLDRQKW